MDSLHYLTRDATSTWNFRAHSCFPLIGPLKQNVKFVDAMVAGAAVPWMCPAG